MDSIHNIAPWGRTSMEVAARDYCFNEILLNLLKPVTVVVRKLKKSTLRHYTKQLHSSYTLTTVPQAAQHLQEKFKRVQQQPERRYPKPPLKFFVILIIILCRAKAKWLSYTDIETSIGELFPYYKVRYRTSYTYISKLTSGGDFEHIFLKKKRHSEGEHKLFIRLNPLKKSVWEKFINRQNFEGFEDQLRASTPRPDSLDALLSGIGHLIINKKKLIVMKPVGRPPKHNSVLGRTLLPVSKLGGGDKFDRFSQNEVIGNKIGKTSKLLEAPKTGTEISAVKISASSKSAGNMAGSEYEVNNFEPSVSFEGADSDWMPTTTFDLSVPSSLSDNDCESKSSVAGSLPPAVTTSQVMGMNDSARKGSMSDSSYISCGKDTASLHSSQKHHIHTTQTPSEGNKRKTINCNSQNKRGRFMSEQMKPDSLNLKAQGSVYNLASSAGSDTRGENNLTKLGSPDKDPPSVLVKLGSPDKDPPSDLVKLGSPDKDPPSVLPVLKNIRSETPVIDTVKESQDSDTIISQNSEMVIPIITEVTSLAATSRKLGSISNDQSEITELFQNNDNDSSVVMNMMSADNWTLNEPQCSDASVLPQVIHSKTTLPHLWSPFKGKPGQSSQGNLCNVTSKTTATPVAPSISTNNPVNNISVIPINTSKGAAAVPPNSVSSSVPNVSSCIQTWQRVFSWMVYRESDHSFTCRICDWGAVQSTSDVVFALTDPSEVYLVAGNLRSHQESRSHKMMAFKTSLIVTFFKTIYPTLKQSLYKGLDDIISAVVNLCGGIFPGPRVSPQKEYFTSYMIKHIAECIEINLIESLTNSPFFSIIAVEGKDFAILRWLNQKGEPVEHFLCSKIFCSAEDMTITSYLQKKKVDTTKMISFRLFPSSTERPSSFVRISQLPVRYPPLAQLMNWLQKMDLFKDTFTHLEVLTRLCKSSHPRLNNFPETAEIAQFEEPFSHACLLNERVVKFFFGNVDKLKQICHDIYIKTGSLDALSISQLELRKSESVQSCVSLLLKLQEMFNKECSYFHLFELIKGFRCSVCEKLKSVESCDPDEYVVLSVLDIYLSHVIISLLTPEQKFANIFIRKLSKITVNDIEQIIKHLNIQFAEGALQCFMRLRELHTRVSKHRDFNIIELLNNFSIDPKLCKDFPQLFYLYQKIKVVPFLRACTEQYMFNLAVLEMLSTDTVEKRLLPSLSLIALEGPPMEDINLDLVLDLWSKKWKMYIERK